MKVKPTDSNTGELVRVDWVDLSVVFGTGAVGLPQNDTKPVGTDESAFTSTSSPSSIPQSLPHYLLYVRRLNDQYLKKKKATITPEVSQIVFTTNYFCIIKQVTDTDVLMSCETNI